MEPFTRGNGMLRLILEMEKVFKFGLMDQYMKGIGRMTKLMERGG